MLSICGPCGPGLVLYNRPCGPGLVLYNGPCGPGLALYSGPCGPGLALYNGPCGPGLVLYSGPCGPGLVYITNSVKALLSTCRLILELYKHLHFIIYYCYKHCICYTTNYLSPTYVI